MAKRYNYVTRQWEDFVPEGQVRTFSATGDRYVNAENPKTQIPAATNFSGTGLMGTGAAIGSLFGPVGTAVGAGAGGLIEAVGSGISAGQEQENWQKLYDLKLKEQEEAEKQAMIANQQKDRGLNMQGISMLADERAQALQNAKGQRFKSDLLKLAMR